MKDAAAAFRFMLQARHIGKIVLSNGGGECRIRPDSAYLVTGGLSGLGLLTAEWLSTRGAAELLLMGRTSPDEDSLRRIGQMRAAGTRAHIVNEDVAVEAGVSRALEQALLPLRGVFHSAGVLADGVLSQTSPERFAAVLRAKVAGAWNLHRLTRHMPLDHFVLYSSAASVLGARGQANHAAANAFLDAMAHQRRRDGLCALSVNWGAWSGTGAAVRTGTARSASAHGFRTIAPAAGIAILERLIAQRRSCRRRHPGRLDRHLAKILRSGSGPYSARSCGGGKTFPSTRKPVRSIPCVTTRRPSGVRELVCVLQKTACHVLGLQDAGLAPRGSTAHRNGAGFAHGARTPESVGHHFPTAVPGQPPVRPSHARPLWREHIDSIVFGKKPEAAVAAGIDLVANLESLTEEEIDRLLSGGAFTGGVDAMMKEFLDRIANLSPKRLALLAAQLNEKVPALEKAAAPQVTRSEPVAIVGMACRMPGGIDGPEAFWRALREGADLVSATPPDRWSLDDWYSPDPDAPGKAATKWGGFLDTVDQFDRRFFGITPKEAASMDPQQRLLLETTWHALEDAGVCRRRSRRQQRRDIPRHLQFRLCASAALAGSETDRPLPCLRHSPFHCRWTAGLCARVAGARDCRGYCLFVFPGCDSSGVPVTAASGMRNGDRRGRQRHPQTGTDGRAIQIAHAVAGRQMQTVLRAGRWFRPWRGLRRDHPRRLSDAQTRGDRVLAVIRGSACNQDGRSSGLTAPNGAAQEAVIRAALGQRA